METELEIKLQKEDFEKLFMAISKGYMAAKAEADRQRAMGKHDYNIFTLFHDFSDEVNLHSNFIASLLDPNGDHYKGDLFLKLFLETCGIDDFSIDTSRATVFKEFKHIDIYISDGKKHIILENKVYAKDQPTQIARYIDTIQNKGAKECDRVKDENIYVLYLHPDGELPKENSLGGYKLNQDNTKLEKDGSSINFKVISYGNEILEWIDMCKNEVSNITDLNVFLSQYKDVIEMIYDRYKRIDEMETANLVEIFKENTITIDMFGSSKYRNYKYEADDHVAVVHTENLPKHAAIYVATAIHKVANAGQFSYARNFYAKDADELNILLPVLNGEICYEFMNDFIKAIEKLVIKDVVLWADKKIETTKKVVNKA